MYPVEQVAQRLAELEARVEAIEIAPSEKRPAWRPIETAPKDGTRILAWNGRWVLIAYWGKPDPINAPAWIGGDCRIVHIDQPKLWQPIHPPGDAP